MENIIQFSHGIIRPLQAQDAESIARHANNLQIANQLRDAFPHPYSQEDAEAFIAICNGQVPAQNFAIVVEGEAAGVIGVKLNNDIERFSAEIGYWLGAAYWGRGISTEVLKRFSSFAMEHFSLNRLYALPFSDNMPSIRVLEKAGYTREGVLSQSAYKNGKFKDQCLYALVG